MVEHLGIVDPAPDRESSNTNQKRHASSKRSAAGSFTAVARHKTISVSVWAAPHDFPSSASPTADVTGARCRLCDKPREIMGGRPWTVLGIDVAEVAVVAYDDDVDDVVVGGDDGGDDGFRS
jgi:hypothetical protein